MKLNELILILQEYPNPEEEVKILAMSEIYEGLGMECEFKNIVPMNFESGKGQCACIAINGTAISSFNAIKKSDIH